MTETVLSSRQVRRITGLSQRQLRYWRQTELIVPSQQTSGGHARYSFLDLIALKSAKRLLDAGVPLQRIRKCIASLVERLPALSVPLAQVSLLVTDDIVLVFHQGSVFDALSGQEWIFPVADLLRDVEQISAKPDARPFYQQELFPDMEQGPWSVTPAAGI
ncbi:MAG: MerR family transcriptional regulator [Gammaproteobacteria bacterium]|nr:MAG: MerR family transcriptional regulator [Gammaproteobacteria bacterium]TND03952.1 MAG: MerR family transcriptional regulator [Gammaproteobacteria bacterium]